MRELVEAIRARGVGVGTDIVKVDMFLNHRLDTDYFKSHNKYSIK